MHKARGKRLSVDYPLFEAAIRMFVKLCASQLPVVLWWLHLFAIRYRHIAISAFAFAAFAAFPSCKLGVANKNRLLLHWQLQLNFNWAICTMKDESIIHVWFVDAEEY